MEVLNNIWFTKGEIFDRTWISDEAISYPAPSYFSGRATLIFTAVKEQISVVNCAEQKLTKVKRFSQFSGLKKVAQHNSSISNPCVFLPFLLSKEPGEILQTQLRDK